METNKKRDAIKTSNVSFPWLKSPPGNEFFLLRLPNITDEMLHNAISFISNKCFYYDDMDSRKKNFLHLPDITVKKSTRDSIPLERLFKEAVNGEEVKHDDFRYQTLPKYEPTLL